MALKHASEDTLFFVAMGPCAGTTVYDLSLQGYQALYIVHVDLEYEWYISGQEVRGLVKHKYNNKIPGGDVVEETESLQEYFEQIVAGFS